MLPIEVSNLSFVVLGLLASGGSGFWNAILTYVLQVKNLKKAAVQKVAEAESSLLSSTSLSASTLEPT